MTEELHSEGDNEVEDRRVSLADFVPSEWGSDAPYWLSAYHVLLASHEELFPSAPGPLPIPLVDLTGARALVYQGNLVPFEAGEAKIAPWVSGPPQFEVKQARPWFEDRRGTWLLVLVREDIGWSAAPEVSVRQAIDAVVSLFLLLAGRNAAFEMALPPIRIEGDQRSIISPMFENPGWFGPPNLDGSTLAAIEQSGAALFQGDDDNTQLRVSVRWAHRAISLTGPDAFLSWWIALETLGMPDTTNIRPLEEKFAEIYEITRAEARDRFRIHLLFDRRGAIVHRGEATPVSGNLLQYMQCLFTDLLCSVVGLEADRAGRMLDSTEDVEELVRYGR